MELDKMMAEFRLASRELFNQFYRVPDGYNKNGWALEEGFSEVQEILFRTIVLDRCGISPLSYGQLNPNIVAELKHGEFAPIMLNREIDSGYWDHPIHEVTRDARMLFVRFFDWDQLDVRDNRYVRVKIEAWPSKPEAAGKHALIESQYVRFIDA